MRLWTDAIDSHGFIDPRYTCDIDNSSPELRWEDIPPETQSLALVVLDLDGPRATNGAVTDLAPQFGHWVVYQIPPTLFHLPAGIPPMDVLPNGIRQGLNDFNKLGYAGPCPPRNSAPHHYRFRLFALAGGIELTGRLKQAALQTAIAGHVLATAEIEGKYQRMLERVG